MHKPSPGRMAALKDFATTLGLSAVKSTAQVFRKHRGDAPIGKKWISGVYMPGGERCNVLPTIIRNPKVAAHVQMMHEKWLAAKTARKNMQAMKEIVP